MRLSLEHTKITSLSWFKADIRTKGFSKTDCFELGENCRTLTDTEKIAYNNNSPFNNNSLELVTIEGSAKLGVDHKIGKIHITHGVNASFLRVEEADLLIKFNMR